MNDKCWIPKMNRNFSLQHHIQTSVGTVDTEGQGGWILKVITYLYSAVDCSECVELYLNFPIHFYDTVLLDTGTGEKYLNVQVPLKSYIFECTVIFFFKKQLSKWMGFDNCQNTTKNFSKLFPNAAGYLQTINYQLHSDIEFSETVVVFHFTATLDTSLPVVVNKLALS